MSAPVATINVGIHEVPLPAYWRIVDLHTAGRPEAEIVRLIIDTMGPLNPGGNVRAVREVVRGVVDNQRRIAAGGEPAAASAGGLNRSNANAGVRRLPRDRKGRSRGSDGSVDSKATTLFNTPSPPREPRVLRVPRIPPKNPARMAPFDAGMHPGTTTAAAATAAAARTPPSPPPSPPPAPKRAKSKSTQTPSPSLLLPTGSPAFQLALQTLQNALTAAILAENTLAARAADLIATRARFTRQITDIDYEEAKRAEAGVDREIRCTLRRRQVAEEEVSRLRAEVERAERIVAVGR